MCMQEGKWKERSFTTSQVESIRGCRNMHPTEFLESLIESGRAQLRQRLAMKHICGAWKVCNARNKPVKVDTPSLSRLPPKESIWHMADQRAHIASGSNWWEIKLRCLSFFVPSRPSPSSSFLALWSFGLLLENELEFGLKWLLTSEAQWPNWSGFYWIARKVGLVANPWLHFGTREGKRLQKC